MRKVYYHNILARKIASDSQEDKFITENCKLIKHRSDKSLLDAEKFIAECSKSPYTCTKYFEDILDVIRENASNYDLVKNFEANILPFVKSNYNRRYDNMGIDSELTNAINDQVRINEAADRILYNHESLSTVYPIEEYANKTKSPRLITYKISKLIENYHMPIYGKIVIASEEAKYLMDKNIIPFTDKEILSAAKGFYSLREGYVDLYDKIPDAINKNVYIREDSTEEDNNTSSPIDLFRIAPDKTIDLLKQTIQNTITTNTQSDYGMGDLLNLFREIIYASDNEDLVSFIIKYNPGMGIEVYNSIYNLEDKLNAKKILTNATDILGNHMNEVSFMITKDTDEELINRLISYKTALYELYTNLLGLTDIVYERYNLLCKKNVITESTEVISLDEYKVFKNENLINLAFQVDKKLSKEMQEKRKQDKEKFNQMKKDIFNESIYDSFDANGNIDYIASILYKENLEDITAEDQKELVSICKNLNENLLRDTPYHCFYEVIGYSAEIHLTENMVVNFSEEERIELENYISDSDTHTITLLEAYSKYGERINLNQIDTMINLLSEANEPTAFSDFLEISSYIGIDPDIIHTIFESVVSRKSSEDKDSFYQRNYFLNETYSPREYTSLDPLQLEASLQLSDILNEFNQYKSEKDKYSKYDEDFENAKKKDKEEEEKESKSRYADYDEDEDNSDDDEEDDNEDKDKKDKDEEDEDDDIEEEEIGKDGKKQKTSFGAKLNVAKLYLMGLNKHVKDFDSKYQEKSKQISYSMNKFISDINDAKTAERRDAIIKGKVLPSFNTCLKTFIVSGLSFIGVGGGPIGFIVVVIELLASYSLNKKLDNKERQLILDDLDIELDMLEKEINDAESRGEMKRLRALLTTKKQIQRTYQRIKYRMKLGKDLIAPANYGVPNKEDE